jgi:DNA-binding LytR/AlgR family response regulator
MRILVADDEALARRRLIRMLGEMAGLEVVAEAANGREVLAEVARTHPDVVLLDIEMPELEGLSVARRLAPSTRVVFVTAYEEHAVRAFALDAVDYLLKPVRRERLAEALRRVSVRRASNEASSLAVVEDAVLLAEAARVVAHVRGTARFFDARHITRFWALDKYTAFLAEGEEQLTDEPLTALEERLSRFGFVRTHRAQLVRSSAIRSLRTRGGAAEACLADGQRVPVSRRMLYRLKHELGL